MRSIFIKYEKLYLKVLYLPKYVCSVNFLLSVLLILTVQNIILYLKLTAAVFFSFYPTTERNTKL